MKLLTKYVCHGFIFQPQNIVVDFEKATHNAYDLIRPNVKIMGCRFHITQNQWRAVQRFGSIKDYKTRTKIGDWLRICFR